MIREYTFYVKAEGETPEEAWSNFLDTADPDELPDSDEEGESLRPF